MLPTSVSQPEQCHLSFYKFVQIEDPDAIVDRFRDITEHLTGSLLIAQEGINGVIAGPVAQVDSFEHALRTDPELKGLFTDIVIKRTLCSTLPFGRMKVHKKPEIVALGVEGIQAIGKPGVQLSPAQWRELLNEDDVVVIDNRNSFEYRLGHFNKAIDPKVSHFRDFPEFIEHNLDTWKSSGKKVAMYCTGGIRCEKTGAWLQERGLTVYQLEGGILNYFAQMPDADRDWTGECFVFDSRIALDTHLNETSTTLEDVYDEELDGKWRVERARRLSGDDF